MVEGTTLITVMAYIPLADTNGLGSELSSRSGGGATAPTMSFSHWEVVESDPFWKPSTEEEREEFGEAASGKGGDLSSTGMKIISRKFVREVRTRKGLVNEEKLVVAADKQRNISRKK